MKEMIQARKEQLQKRGKKGFTLMEMLIVVAIIAVLIAIAIPVFLAQLDKARAETDVANVRSGYASAVATVMTDNVNTAATFYLQKDGSVRLSTDAAAKTNAYECQGDAANADQSELIGGVKNASSVGWKATNYITYTYTPASGTTPASWDIAAEAKS